MLNNLDKQAALICMGAGPSQVPVIEKAESLGFPVIAMDINPKAPGFSFASEALITSTHDYSNYDRLLEQYSPKYDILGILNRSSGPPVISAAYLSQMLNLPGISLESAATLVDKFKLRKACMRFGIPSPAFGIHSASYIALPENLKWPVVIKPSLSLVGKSGISIAHNETELDTAIKYAAENSLSDSILLEEYLTGDDLSLVSFVEEGQLFPICILDELNGINSSGFVFGQGFSAPSRYSGSQIEMQIHNIAQALITGFNINRSPFMVSFRLDGEANPKLIEVHLDMGGDLLIEHLFPKALSVDFLEIAVKLAAGVSIKKNRIDLSPTAILYEQGEKLVTERNFRLFQASDIESLNKMIDGESAHA